MRQNFGLKSSSSFALDADLMIYNSRGQQLAIRLFRWQSMVLDNHGFDSGIYLYKVLDKKSGKAHAAGKFMVL